MSTQQKTKHILWVAILTWLSCDVARATIDIGRATMGRTTYPERSLVLDYFNTAHSPNAHDPAKDTLQHKLELEYGYTDCLTLALGMKTKKAKRGSLVADRLIVEGIYRLIEAPFQLAPFVEFLPSLQGSPSEWEFGFDALKNRGPWSLDLHYAGEIEKDGGEYELEKHTIHPSLFYRFGLNGVTGVGWEYESDGAHSLNIFLGGRVSKNIFLAIEPQFGISRQAPDFTLAMQINFYFGPYYTSGLE